MSVTVRKPIRVLDSASVDRIAAGEVIERPASVVKELVENALDAGASSIRVSIREGGAALIAVDDDGHGIPFKELPLVFERHATSKIVSAADILQVSSFGFRGEAMASIASVARVTLLSRVAEEEVGGLIRVSGSVHEKREPAPRNRGTTITVEDLFFNTPARRKYMKAPQAEKKAIIHVVNSIAMAYPEVRWRLEDDGQTIIDLLPADSLPARARDILGPGVAEHLARFDLEEKGIAVGGLASRPTVTRPNRSAQYLYVNRRPIRSQQLAMAVQQAYREVIPPGRHPVTIIFIQVPLGEVDVNVHPAKTEVRLMLERSIFSLIHRGLRDGLDLRSHAAFHVQPDRHEHATDQAGPLERLAAAQEDYLRRQFTDPGADPRPDQRSGQGSLFAPRPADDGGAPVPAAGEIRTQGDSSPLRSAPFWQLHRTYICTQTKGGLVIIDQHNSHERILYNEALKAIADGAFAVPVQQLLFPVTLDLTALQVQAYQMHQAQLERLGFLIQPFGGRSILIQGIPSSLRNWEEGRLLLDILDDLSEHERGQNDDTHDLVASFACHGAIRAGALLTVPEMQNLVDKLFATDVPLSCPHGRPTLIQFSTEELERRFGRR
ncbi:MAG TPA: DNA mismatch repair endonuclease MutL [Candidatus Krumholzibacteria bacterium]|nr:DNA mismatch repair endonuclease MutL [Candidatus Krumholzibacteria bacterium]HRX52055.1 DNA mismatch repair endonuclease MutL [Candidatus Krumholzibacteria bacterium]